MCVCALNRTHAHTLEHLCRCHIVISNVLNSSSQTSSLAHNLLILKSLSFFAFAHKPFILFIWNISFLRAPFFLSFYLSLCDYIRYFSIQSFANLIVFFSVFHFHVNSFKSLNAFQLREREREKENKKKKSGCIATAVVAAQLKPFAPFSFASFNRPDPMLTI